MTKLQEQILEFCKTAHSGKDISDKFGIKEADELQGIYECGMQHYLKSDYRSGTYFDYTFKTTYLGITYLEEQNLARRRYIATVATSVVAIILSIVSIIVAASPNTVNIRSLPPVELQMTQE